jgi:solute carrier family 8 (sodium/calcium exchanger)
MHAITRLTLFSPLACAIVAGKECVAGMNTIPTQMDVSSPDFRAVLFLLLLAWAFLGVALVADIFMAAVEEVTSKKQLVKMKNGRMQTRKVWNDTVANLTLMAFGSSAPEILLSVLELVFNDFYAAELGPGTIVGSAAFNLLVIIAVCVYVIPNGEVRKVKEIPVLIVTGIGSIFAYCWLVICLQVITPNKVDIAEGVLTFCYFPLLVLLAFLADKGYLTPSSDDETDGETTPLDAQKDEQVSRAKRHTEAMQSIAATKRVLVDSKEPDDVTVEFASAFCHVFVEDTTTQLMVRRRGNLSCVINVPYRFVIGDTYASSLSKPTVKRQSIRPGELEASDKSKTIGVIEFKVNQEIAVVDLTLVGEAAPSEGGSFMVELFDPQIVKDYGHNVERLSLGTARVCKVDFITERGPGTFCFMEPQMKVPIPAEAIDFPVSVLRIGGSDGEVSCKFRTERMSAIPGKDYDQVDQQIFFHNGQAQYVQTIRIHEKEKYECEDQFRITLEDATGGADFNPDDDGGADACIGIVTILAHEDGGTLLRTVDKYVNVDMVCGGFEDWKDQIMEALYVNGSKEEQEDAPLGDWVKHMIAFPWKIVFATVPPTSMFGGWLCFVIAIMYIGLVTMLVGDAASIFGCLIGLEDQITAITCVALGTSLPDTFASMSAAVNDATADASIGNVTGSNSVNVFFGLGLPWIMASVYWHINGKTDAWLERYAPNGELLPILDASLFADGGFVVPAGNLVFSVVTFLIVSLLCMGVLALRRRVIGAELGGPVALKKATSLLFLLLWCFYVAMSTWKVYDRNGNAGSDDLVTIVGVMAAGLVFVVTTVIIATFMFANGGNGAGQPPDGGPTKVMETE